MVRAFLSISWASAELEICRHLLSSSNQIDFLGRMGRWLSSLECQDEPTQLCRGTTQWEDWGLKFQNDSPCKRVGSWVCGSDPSSCSPTHDRSHSTSAEWNTGLDTQLCCWFPFSASPALCLPIQVVSQNLTIWASPLSLSYICVSIQNI